MVLKLTEAQLEQIRLHAEAMYPHECCGVFTGEVLPNGAKKVLEAVPCINTHNDASRSWYQVDARDLVRIQREAYERNQDIIGFYHSHPDDVAHWSASDLAEAHWPGCSYVITAVEKGKAGQTNSFELVGDEVSKHFEDEEVSIE